MADEAAAAKHNNEVGNIFDHRVDSSKSIVLCDRFSYNIHSTEYAKSLIIRKVWAHVCLTDTLDNRQAPCN